MNYFKLPNYIFECDLTVTEISVLAVLYSKAVINNCSRQKQVYIKQTTIASTLNIKSTKTVSKAIKSLAIKGLIVSGSRKRKSNGLPGTYIYTLPATTDKYFTVKRNIFNYNLSTVQMRMYLFICKSIDVRINKCWNSYNDIACKLKIARSSAIKTIRELVNLGVLFCKNVKNKNKSFSDNHYSLVAFVEVKLKIRKATTLQMSSPIKNLILLSSNLNINYILIIIICQIKIYKVKYILFIFIRGSTIIYRCIYKTHLKPYYKEININFIYITKYISYNILNSIIHKFCKFINFYKINA